MIKALFFDIDGTLVSFKTHKMSDGLKQSLLDVRKKGIKILISTGRSPLTFDPLEDFPFDGYVSMNGALNVLDGEVVDDHPLRQDMSRVIADYAMERNIPCWVFGDNVAGMNCLNDHAREIISQTELEPKHFYDLRELVDEHEIYQYSIFLTEEEIKSELHPLVPDAEYPRWHPYFCDVIMPGLSKSYGASKILEKLGVSADECIAFGDGGNDIPIIEYAGIGVAMGNASDDVKSVADYVTSPVDEDGIPAALRHFGLL